MNKTVLALSTALSIFAITPAFAQNNTPAVDCTQQANKSDPACMNQNNNSGATQTQTQGQSGTSTTTDQNAAQSGSSTTTDQNAAQSGTSTTTKTDQNAAATTTTQSSTQQMSSGELIVPADRLNSAQVMSASDYIGKTVYDQGGNNIGDVNDLIISQDGQIQAVTLGVGGFLGIGEKDVAVNTNAIQMVQDGDNKRLVVQATKEALNNAPTYDKNNRRYAAQQNGGATTDTTGSTTAPANDASGNTSNKVTIDCSLAANASDPACVNKTQTQQ